MSRRISQRVTLTVVPVLATAFLSGCGDEQQTAYCVNDEDEVIADINCDTHTTSGGYYWFYTGNTYSRGSRISRSNGDLVSTTDTAENARRGGFGSSAKAGGVGRAVAVSGGG